MLLCVIQKSCEKMKVISKIGTDKERNNNYVHNVPHPMIIVIKPILIKPILQEAILSQKKDLTLLQVQTA